MMAIAHIEPQPTDKSPPGSDKPMRICPISGRGISIRSGIDAEGEILDVLVQSKRNKNAALNLMRKLLKKYAFVLGRLITDDLPSYSAAARDLGIEHLHERGRWKNNRAENSHLFSASDVMLDGVLQAAGDANRTGIKILSVDGSKKAVDLVEQGAIVGTMAQFPGKMGPIAVENLLAVLGGKKAADSIPKVIDSGTMVYDKSNLAEARKWAF